jgi:hypothetical protein
MALAPLNGCQTNPRLRTPGLFYSGHQNRFFCRLTPRPLDHTGCAGSHRGDGGRSHEIIGADCRFTGLVRRGARKRDDIQLFRRHYRFNSGTLWGMPPPFFTQAALTIAVDFNFDTPHTWGSFTLPDFDASFFIAGFPIIPNDAATITLTSGNVTAWDFHALVGGSSGYNVESSTGGDSIFLPIFNQASTGGGGSGTWSPTFSPTPIPATFPFFAAGIAALALFGWRRRATGAHGTYIRPPCALSCQLHTLLSDYAFPSAANSRSIARASDCAEEPPN